MKTRKEAAAYARRVFYVAYDIPQDQEIHPTTLIDHDPDPDDHLYPDHKDAWHWGKVEIAALMDFIYEGEPQSQDEEIWTKKNLRNR